MTDRLTDAELDKVDFVFDGPTGLSMTVRALVAEVREHRAARTLTDLDARWFRECQQDYEGLPAHEDLARALAIIDRITKEATDG